MGVYLSSPVTEKESVDGHCDRFVYGASSMQGWRISQEDAHNCIPLFDEKTKSSLFAVYDGHGGSEVAKYCEKHFPDFVKKLMESQTDTDDPAHFIKNAFLAFDETLTKEEVIKELKVLAGDDDNEDDEDDDPVGRSETELLKEEANMPLDQLLAQYKSTTPKEVENSPEKRSQSPTLKSTSASSSNVGDSSEDVHNGPSSSSSSASSVPTPSTSSSSSCNQDASSQLSNGKDDVHNSNEAEQAQGIVSADSDSSSTHASNCNNNNIDISTTSLSHKSSPSTVIGQPLLPSSANNTKQEAADNHCINKLADVDSNDNSSASQPGGSTTAAVSSLDDDVEPSGSGTSSSADVRASKAKAAVDIAMIDGDVDTSDDDEDEEDVWEDMSDDDDDDDDEEDGPDENVPMMNMNDEEEPGSDSGCTACVVLMQGKKLIVANAGDSRCVLSRAGKAVELSFDHKPEDEPEKERIENAGGKVTGDGRVNGGLNLSRAIGDHVYKRNKDLPAEEQMITALPDVEAAELCNDDQFIVIACDGIWNYMTSQEVVDFVLEKLKDPEKRQKPSAVCEELFDYCLAPNTSGDGTGCDNMTCIIVVLDTFTNPITQQATPEAAAHTKEAVSKSQENSSEQLSSNIDERGDASSNSLKRCSNNTEVNEGKRLKINEELS